MITDRKEMNVSSPLRSIRAMCLECVGYVSDEVKNCTAPDCPLYLFRLGRSVRGKSRLKAIRKLCLECMGGSSKTVAECSSGPRHGENDPGCSVFEYRFGKNPKMAHRRPSKQAIEALKKYRREAISQGENLSDARSLPNLTPSKGEGEKRAVR